MTGESIQTTQNGDKNELSPNFVMFQNVKHQIACITNLQCSNKAEHPHYSDSVFNAFQKYFFNVHQIATLVGKFNIFLSRQGQNIPLIIHWNTPSFQIKIQFFQGRKTIPSPSDALPIIRQPSLLDPSLRPPKFQPDLCHCGQIWVSWKFLFTI